MMTTQTVSSSDRIDLSNGRSLHVRGLRWSAYKQLKADLAGHIAGEFAELIVGAMAGQFDGSAIVPKVASLLQEAEGLNEKFLRGCIGDESAFDEYLPELSVHDIAKLNAAALQINPIESILEFEKNSPAGALVSQVLPEEPADAPAQTQAPAEPDPAPADGGSDSSPDLYDPAGPSES